MLHISATVNRYGDGLDSPTINVIGLRRTRFSRCQIGVVPEGREGRKVFQGPMVPGPWGYTVTHAIVIDGRKPAPAIPVEVGQPFTVEGLPGVWTFRDPRNFEGDGAQLTEYTA